MADDIHLPLLDKEQSKTDKMGAQQMKTSDMGLKNVRALLFLFLWYFFSGCTLFLNKYILSYRDGDATLLGSMQMLMTLCCGFIQMYYPLGMGPKVVPGNKPKTFYRQMFIIGGLRFTTVLLGLIALNFVAVSFTETVKSSAPAFTVVISRILLGSKTGFYVKLSLLPVMGGLALCSANELSYNLPGFVAALGTNISECCQNVYSKMLLSSGDQQRVLPAELQFYTSLASIVVTVPTCLIMMDWNKVAETDVSMLLCLLLNGTFFHFQTITAYVLMDYISPVTHSVANTGKRAFLIWTSVILFGNDVTFMSGLGTMVVIFGVLLYNQALVIDAEKNGKFSITKVEKI